MNTRDPNLSDPNLTDAPAPLVEGVDYYIDDGRWVFTEHYLRRRGTCCGNGCRHCPFGRVGPGATGPVGGAS